MGRLPRFLAGARVHPDTKTLNLRDVCLTENARIMRAHGAFDGPAWLRVLRRERHRWPAQFRKAWWRLRQALGTLPMARAYYPGDPLR